MGETKSSTFEAVCDEICAEGTSAWQSWKQLRGHGSKTKDLHARASVLDDKECVEYMNRFVRRHCSKYGRTFDRAVAMLNSFLQSKDLPAVFSLAGGELAGSPRVATPTMSAARPPVAPAKQSKPTGRRARASAGAGKKAPAVAKLSAKRLADVGLENVASADAHASLLLLAIKVDVFSTSEPPAAVAPQPAPSASQRAAADALPPAHGPMGGKAARVATLGLRSPLRKLMLEQVVLV